MPAGTDTLGHRDLARHSGGQGMAEALRSVVGSDADIHGRFTAAPATALQQLPQSPRRSWGRMAMTAYPTAPY